MKRRRVLLFDLHDELAEEGDEIIVQKKRIVYNVDIGISVLDKYKIKRSKLWQLYSTEEQRVHSMGVFDKRVINAASYATLPFGF
jgi:hypothetical protein